MAKRKKKELGCLASFLYLVLIGIAAYALIWVWNSGGKEILLVAALTAGVVWLVRRLFPYVSALRIIPPSYDILDADRMSAAAFSRFCAGLLRRRGYQQVRRLPGKNGGGMIARLDGITYAIRCKRDSVPLGEQIVREAMALKADNGCGAAMIITNVQLTRDAVDLAIANDVALIDRPWLVAWISDPTGTPGMETPRAVKAPPEPPAPAEQPQADPGIRLMEEARARMRESNVLTDPVKFAECRDSAQRYLDACRKNALSPALREKAGRMYIANASHLDEDLIVRMEKTQELAMEKITGEPSLVLRKGAGDRIVAQLEAVQPYCGDIAEPVRQRILAEVRLAMEDCENVSN